MGTLRIRKAGPQVLEIKPAAEYGHNLMFFQSLELAPVGPLTIECYPRVMPLDAQVSTERAPAPKADLEPREYQEGKKRGSGVFCGRGGHSNPRD